MRSWYGAWATTQCPAQPYRTERTLGRCRRRAGASAADAAERERLARELFDFCHANLAYYKAPGYLWLAESISTTATQKIQKHAIFAPDADPRQLAGMIDLRHLKKRGTPPPV